MAISLLQNADIAEVYSASTSTFPAKHWLDTYRTSFVQMARKSSFTPANAALQKIKKLPANNPVTLLAYG